MIDWRVFENVLIVEALGMLPHWTPYPENYYQAEQIVAMFRGWA
jgi:hypothetical protein